MGAKKFVLAFLFLALLGSAILFQSRENRAKKRVFLENEKFIPFQTSMSRRDPAFIPQVLEKKLRKDARWKKLYKLYERNILESKPSPRYRIPKIIHQIWLGGPLPEKYKEIQKTWQKYHPDWEYRLWTDEDAKNFAMKNRELFDSATNLGEKADIFRYEILYRHGGLYVDTDFECLRSFDTLHKLCDFYIGIDTLERKFRSPRLSNALLASIPGHPLLEQCLKSMSGEGPRDNFDLIQQRTGPGLVTRAFLAQIDDLTYKNVALPSSYFYPLPAPERNGSFGGAIKEAWVQNESFAIHYWDGSWINKKEKKR